MEDPCKAPIPEGLQQHLNKMLRAVILSRPVQLNQFFAEYFEAELDRRTLTDLQSSDVFIRIDEEILQQISEPLKRAKSPDKSYTKPSAAPVTKHKEHKEHKAHKVRKTEEMKQMSGDDLDSDYYVNYFLTHEADDTTFDYGPSDAEYHEGHAFGDDDQIGRDSQYYIDYFLTHETIKRKTRTDTYVQEVHDAYVPVQYDGDNFVDYFLMLKTDPTSFSFDQSDREYSKAYCMPFQDASRRNSEYCREYFMTCEAAPEETKFFASDFGDDDNFVDYFLTHETEPRISSFDRSDREYSKGYCLPFQDVSRLDSEYCMNYFLTCVVTEEETFVSDSTSAIPKESEKDEDVVGEGQQRQEQRQEQREEEVDATGSLVFTTFPSKEAFGEPGEEPENKVPEIASEEVQKSREDLVTDEEATSQPKEQVTAERDETYITLCGSEEFAAAENASISQIKSKLHVGETTELHATTSHDSDDDCAR